MFTTHLCACLRVRGSTPSNKGKTRQLPSSSLKHFLGYYVKPRETFLLITDPLRALLKCKPFHQSAVWNLRDEPWNASEQKIFIGECHLVENQEGFAHQKNCFKVVRTFSNQRFQTKTKQQNVTTKVHPAAGWTCPRVDTEVSWLQSLLICALHWLCWLARSFLCF